MIVLVPKKVIIIPTINKGIEIKVDYDKQSFDINDYIQHFYNYLVRKAEDSDNLEIIKVYEYEHGK